MTKIILVTGVSGGLGRAVAEAVFGRGHMGVGTVRREEDRQTCEALAPGRALARLLDVTDTAAIAPLIEEIESTCGRIDVLVNNAGYGLRGAVEDLSLEALRSQFEVNVFAPVALIQAVLPTCGGGERVTSSTWPPWAAS